MNENKPIYLAPLEGVTDSIYINTFMKHFGGVKKAFTPFLSPNDTYRFTTREFEFIDPEKNDVDLVVPQLLCCNADHFNWAVNNIAPLGYKEINLNLGCPSGTVVTKKKGSGLLFYPDLLDDFLYQIFDNAKKCGVEISIKTRIGRDSSEEWPEILSIYNKYKIKELTVHPRIRTQMYKGVPDMEAFDFAYKNSKNTLVYNGDVKSLKRADELFDMYPDLSAVMMGRGLIAAPWLLSDEKADVKKFLDFHDELYELFKERMPGEIPHLYRMKEYWNWWSPSWEEYDIYKDIRKCKSIKAYDAHMEKFKSLVK